MDEKSTKNLTAFGFRFGDKGTHTSRTIMLDELTHLLQDCSPTSQRADYTTAIVDHNCLGKRTLSTRRLTSQRLSELYALDPAVPIFRILRQLWDLDPSGRPLLALLAAMVRDPLLLATVTPIIRMHPGEELARQQLVDAITNATGSRLNESTLDKVVRNVSSSWTQSGHLKGRSRKFRQLVQPTPAATTFALVLGYIEGSRGNGLFETQWARLLDRSIDGLIYLAMDAKRLGLLEIKHAGGVIEVSLDRLLSDDERRSAYVPN